MSTLIKFPAVSRKIGRIVIVSSGTLPRHHSVFPAPEASTHVVDIAGLGCHFYIHRNGFIHDMLPPDLPGAAILGFPADSIGICYEGGMHPGKIPADTRTEWQKHALDVLIRALRMNYPGAEVVWSCAREADGEGEERGLCEEFCMKLKGVDN